MAALSFDGSAKRVKWETLGTPVQNLPTGAYTLMWLAKRANTASSNFFALGYLLSGSGGGTTEEGLSFKNSDELMIDADTAPQTAATFVDETLPYLLILSKAAGSATPELSWQLGKAGGMTHVNLSTTMGDQIAATMLELGAWQGGADFFQGWMGVFAAWSGAMSQARKAAIGAAWSTNAVWTSAHGTPVALLDLNVAAASVTDAAGNVSNQTVSSATLDSGETMDTWTFGISVPQIAVPDADTADGSWLNEAGSNTNLFASIDETVASNADYIESSASPGSPDICKVSLGSMSDPASSVNHKVSYRYGKDFGGDDKINLTVRLKQGSTTIASWTHTDIPVGPVDVTQTLSGGEADTITDYSNLDLWFESVLG